MSPAPSTRPSRGGPPHPAPPRASLHPETRQLAQHLEIEIGVLQGQCLGRRIDDPNVLEMRSQYSSRPHQPDVHNGQSSRQLSAGLSRHAQRVKFTVTEYLGTEALTGWSAFPRRLSAGAARAPRSCAVRRVDAGSGLRAPVSESSDRTESGVTPKRCWMSASAGAEVDARVGVDEGQILALLGREAGFCSPDI